MVIEIKYDDDDDDTYGVGMGNGDEVHGSTADGTRLCRTGLPWGLGQHPWYYRGKI